MPGITQENFESLKGNLYMDLEHRDTIVIGLAYQLVRADKVYIISDI